MSPISIGLDVILVTLLISALAVGLRLNRRLKALREGQESFVKAVGELDVAAARAEAGLMALRAASEDAHDTLLTRIETARGLIVRLDKGVDAATRAAAAIAAPPGPAPHAVSVTPPARPERLEPRFREALSRPARPAVVRPNVRGLDDDLFETTPQAAEALPWRAGDRR